MHNVQVVLPPTLNLNFPFVSIKPDIKSNTCIILFNSNVMMFRHHLSVINIKIWDNV